MPKSWNQITGHKLFTAHISLHENSNMKDTQCLPQLKIEYSIYKPANKTQLKY